jgi:hypothetical protein
MDNIRAPAQLAAEDIAAGLTGQGGPDPVLTAVGRLRPLGNPRQSRAGREQAG